MNLRIENQVKSRKDLTKEAISLALSGEWEQAAGVNRDILDAVPGDVEAMNRLGKALMELGQYGEAREVLGKVISAAPYNNIAKKNLARLDQLGNTPAANKQVRKSVGAPQFFIEESGKSSMTTLHMPGAHTVVASVAPGDPVNLVVENNAICVYVRDDEYLGKVEPKLGRRLIKLIDGGNKYAAAIIGVKEQGISVIIREVYRHPSLHNVCSFPTKRKEEHRVYLGENLLRYIEETDLEDDDEGAVIIDQRSDDSEWEE